VGFTGGGTGSAVAVAAGTASAMTLAPLIAAIASVVQRLWGRLEIASLSSMSKNLPVTAAEEVRNGDYVTDLPLDSIAHFAGSPQLNQSDRHVPAVRPPKRHPGHCRARPAPSPTVGALSKR